MEQTKEHKNEISRLSYARNAQSISESRKAKRKLRTHCVHGHDLSLVGFYEYISRQGHRIRECKSCVKSKNDRRAYQLRASHLRRKFGITPEEYDAMLLSQGGCCAVCRTYKPGGMGEFHVDHCHTTGKVRSLLCMKCNSALGYAEDSADRLRDLASYLEKHNGSV